MITSEQVKMLSRNLEAVGGEENAFTQAFYHRFIANYPEAKKLFANTSIPNQAAMLYNALRMTIAALRDPLTLDRYLGGLGVRHEQSYGVRDIDYLGFKIALIETFQQFLGDAWTDAEREAWDVAFDHIAKIMSGKAPGDHE